MNIMDIIFGFLALIVAVIVAVALALLLSRIPSLFWCYFTTVSIVGITLLVMLTTSVVDEFPGIKGAVVIVCVMTPWFTCELWHKRHATVKISDQITEV